MRIHSNHLLPSITLTVTRLPLVCQTGGDDRSVRVAALLSAFTCPAAAPEGPPPPIWSSSGRSPPLCRQSNGGRTSEPRTSSAWSPPERSQKTHTTSENEQRRARVHFFCAVGFSIHFSHKDFKIKSLLTLPNPWTEENHTITIFDLKQKSIWKSNKQRLWT